MKVKFTTLLVFLVLVMFGQSFGSSITLESVTGTAATNFVFSLRVTNTEGYKFSGIANGFRVWSPEGATWGTLVGDTLPVGLGAAFDVIAINHYPGTGSDTVGFQMAKLMSGTTLPADFDEIAYTLTIGPMDLGNDAGKQICIDSSYYPPVGTWKWAAIGSEGPAIFPNWGGPYCFTIADILLDASSIDGAELPGSFDLVQNYPNPFNPTTQINFDVPTKSLVNISIYNVLGQKVKTLVNEKLEAGSYFEEWNGANDAGTKVSSGIYFYKMSAGDYVKTKKMMMLK